MVNNGLQETQEHADNNSLFLIFCWHNKSLSLSSLKMKQQLTVHGDRGWRTIDHTTVLGWDCVLLQLYVKGKASGYTGNKEHERHVLL